MYYYFTWCTEGGGFSFEEQKLVWPRDTILKKYDKSQELEQWSLYVYLKIPKICKILINIINIDWKIMGVSILGELDELCVVCIVHGHVCPAV